MCAFEDGADGLVLSELLASFPHLLSPFFLSRWTAERTEEVTVRVSEVRGREEELGEEIVHRTRITAEKEGKGGVGRGGGLEKCEIIQWRAPSEECRW